MYDVMLILIRKAGKI